MNVAATPRWRIAFEDENGIVQVREGVASREDTVARAAFLSNSCEILYIANGDGGIIDRDEIQRWKELNFGPCADRKSRPAVSMKVAARSRPASSSRA